MPDDDPLIRVERAVGVATLVLDSPANRNALSSRLMRELRAALDDATTDESVRAVVLTGRGTVFCAGADLHDPPGSTPGEPFSLPSLLQAISTSPKPIIARVNGHVRAGGLGLVAACDIAVAPLDATFAFSEVRLGLVPAIIAVVCQPLMSPRSFARHTLTGTAFDATEAMSSGLVTATVERQQLDHAVAGLVNELLQAAPSAVGRTKALAAQLPTLTLEERFALTAEISARQFQTPDALDGIAAFHEKRPPRWVP
jgi:enoyl-CoA hydratase/carnithine racemase